MKALLMTILRATVRPPLNSSRMKAYVFWKQRGFSFLSITLTGTSCHLFFFSFLAWSVLSFRRSDLKCCSAYCLCASSRRNMAHEMVCETHLCYHLYGPPVPQRHLGNNQMQWSELRTEWFTLEWKHSSGILYLLVKLNWVFSTLTNNLCKFVMHLFDCNSLWGVVCKTKNNNIKIAPLLWSIL